MKEQIILALINLGIFLISLGIGYIFTSSFTLPGWLISIGLTLLFEGIGQAIILGCSCASDVDDLL
jgi:hypothetical protein